MTSSSLATPATISVLVADSNRMQAQMLIGALRRRREFAVSACALDTASILAAKVPQVALLSLIVATSADDTITITACRRFHLSPPRDSEGSPGRRIRSRTWGERIAFGPSAASFALPIPVSAC